MVKIVLEDLDSEVIERLKHRTVLQGMTPEDEIKRMLSLQFPISRTISREDRIARMNEL